MVSTRYQVGFFGGDVHTWPSVERCRQFFLRALQTEFHLEHLPDVATEELTVLPDVIVNYGRWNGWNFSSHPDCSMGFVLLGGPVINRNFLATRLGSLRQKDCLIVTCQSDIRILREMCSDAGPAVCRVSLPIESPAFRPRPMAECRHATGCEMFDFVIGYVARLVPQKNLHQFLYELAELRRALAPAQVGGLIVGDYWIDYPCLPYQTGVYPEKIRELIDNLQLSNSVVYFPGTLNDEDLAMCYGSMDVLFHPTTAIDENYGYAPLEAMGCGVPVVGSAYGGLKDTILHGQTGFLMPTWITSNGIRMDLFHGHHALLNLLRNPAFREKTSSAAVQHVRDAYSFDNCARILCDFIRRSIEGTVCSNMIAAAPLHHAPLNKATLPAVDPPWETYVPSIRHYVSQSCPVLGAGCRIRLAAPLVPEGQETYRLADPAWPAAFHLPGAEFDLASRLSQWQTADSLLACDTTKRKLQSWIEEGLLLCSTGCLHA